MWSRQDADSPCAWTPTSYADAVALRATQATPIMQQVRSDVTRFRYGDEQHLDEALARIFRINKSGGIRRTQSPVLVRLREEVVNDKYALVLGFASALAFEEWEVRRMGDELGAMSLITSFPPPPRL